MLDQQQATLDFAVLATALAVDNSFCRATAETYGVKLVTPMVCWAVVFLFINCTVVSSSIFSIPRLHVRGTRGRRFRTAIAALAAIAIAWPSLGALPWLVHLDHDGHGHAISGDQKEVLDATSIPGSPLHPDDHNCPECQVLKHLSRCMPTGIAVAILAPVVAAVETPSPVVATHDPRPPAYLPPVRAPPKALA